MAAITSEMLSEEKPKQKRRRARKKTIISMLPMHVQEGINIRLDDPRNTYDDIIAYVYDDCGKIIGRN